ncbi:MAG TPA: hypothetical protein VHC44_18750 [Verrucomicrobiae bacterium]|nr:hypothetical protein [Verrucomicrobiae bacterium]
MGYGDSSHASADAVPQASAAATYFIFGPSGSNDFGATEQTQTAIPSAVAATGGPALMSGSPANQSTLPGTLTPSGGLDTQTILLILAGTLGAAFLARKLF